MASKYMGFRINLYGYLEHGYLEHMGLGVPRKIVRGTQEFNGSIPEFIVGEESFTVVLRR